MWSLLLMLLLVVVLLPSCPPPCRRGRKQDVSIVLVGLAAVADDDGRCHRCRRRRLVLELELLLHFSHQRR